ncbi:peptidylprolyl isomerase [bacterium]|nr:peptidylprolyl isomerase [bacterium]
MTVSNRQLQCLGIAAGILLVLTILLYQGGNPARPIEAGALLVQGLDVESVAKVTVRKGDDTVTLARGKTGFVIEEKNSYPATNKQVNELLNKILGIRLAEKVTSDPDNHKDLDVDADSKEATFVALAGADGKDIVTVVVGKSAARGSGAYVRLIRGDSTPKDDAKKDEADKPAVSADDNTVYTTKESIYLTTSATSYTETTILKVEDGDVEEVKVQLKDVTYVLTRDKDEKITLAPIPEGKQAKESELSGVYGALSSVYFDDVLATEPEGAEWNATYTCKTSKHLTYIVKVGKKGEDHYIRLAAQGPSDAVLAKHATIKEDDPKEELEKKDAIFTAGDKAIKFTADHGPWFYKVSSWTAGKMAKPLTDLIEDIPKPDEPEEVAASHILIAYKGSDKADAKITRTKDEARTRAEEALTKAKAEDADFAKLAEEYSDGPSKTKGGDLGTFKKGAMHKNFEAAAWKLEVDALSDIVETPFGFHVIKRTK